MAKAPKIYIRGIARFPKTDQPYSWNDAQNKSIPDEDGKYEIEIVVNPERSAVAEEAIRDYAKQEGKPKPKKVPFRPELDRETEEETGNTIFKAWQYGKDTSGKVRKVAHFDSKGKPLPSDFYLTSGSEVIIAVSPGVFKPQGGGVNLRLHGVQVVKYRERDNNPGFGAVEDGEFSGDDEADNASGFTDESGAEDEGSEAETDF